ncbi:PKD domain-containing protein [Pollutibacter soli]|uniref:PKD domain-containing protein n=1 Tax=Pollutibacter soli TaxID=3034157 RepID=UPI003013D50D
MKKRYPTTVKSILFCLLLAGSFTGYAQKKILVFSKTAGYRHSSIDYGIDAIKKIGAGRGFSVETSEDAADFTTANLSAFSLVIFMSTTGDILNDAQQAAFEKFIQSGGGFVGIHAATDTEYNWPWYGRLVGAWFNGHPDIQQARVNIAGTGRPGNGGIPSPWIKTDEWYNFGSFQSPVTPLLTVDESSYSGGTMGANHPIAWYHDFDGGRAWYTGLGHTDESFSDVTFLSHLEGGIAYAAGNAQTNVAPTANAGNNIQIKLPQTTATLKGTGADSDGNIVSYKWTKISGPAGGIITNAALAETGITALQKGTYVFRLTVTDNDGDTGYDEVSVTVSDAAPVPANKLPVVNAGQNQTIRLPLNTVTLRGYASDTDGTVTGYNWTRVSGPVTGVVIQTPGNAVTNVTGLQQGIYIFRLTATDNSGGAATDDVQIKVDPPLSASNQPPVADAGADKTIILPVNSVVLNGKNSKDPDGTISVWSWVKISGPVDGLMAGANSDQLSLTKLEQGTYVFQLTVTDNRGSSSTDQVTVTVIDNGGPNQTPLITIKDSFFVRLPVQNTELDASASKDPDGSIKLASWQYISGPRDPLILSPDKLKTIVTDLIPGNYHFRLTVTDNRGGTSQKNVVVVVLNSTSRRVIPKVGLYPNPVEEKVTVTIDTDIDGRMEVTFYGLEGKPVLSAILLKNTRVLSQTFDIEALSSGVYTVVIKMERAEPVVRKIVKQ